MMTRSLVSLALAAASAAVCAKLPAPDDAAKAKAAETTAKAAWQAKVDAFQLCKAQDKVAALYHKTHPGESAKPAAANASSAAPAPAGTAATADTAPASAKATSAAAVPATPCSDPGPFAYNPPEQKPLETSGAHSPTGTAASPPSVLPHAAEMASGSKR